MAKWALLKETIGVFSPFYKLLFLLVALILVGSIGYVLVADYPFLEAIYMTVITITTVGYGEVIPLDKKGKVFTIFLSLTGVLFYGITLNTLINFLLEKKFQIFMRREKMQKKLASLRNHYIICGGGRMAYAIAKELERAGKKFVIIENNPESVVMKCPEKERWLILEMDALEEETLQKARIEYAKGLAAVLPTDADNLFVVLSARALNPKLRIETRINTESSRKKMIQAGANKVISPYVAAGIQLARSLINPEVEEFLEVALGKINYEFEMGIHKLQPNDAWIGKSLKELRLAEKGYVIIGVQKGSGKVLFAPRGSIILEEGDSLLFLKSAEV